MFETTENFQQGSRQQDVLLVRRADWERLLEHGHVGRRAKQQHQAMEKCNFSIRQWTGGSSKANQVYCKSLRTEWDKSGTTIRGKCLLPISPYSPPLFKAHPHNHIICFHDVAHQAQHAVLPWQMYALFRFAATMQTTFCGPMTWYSRPHNVLRRIWPHLEK